MNIGLILFFLGLVGLLITRYVLADKTFLRNVMVTEYVDQPNGNIERVQVERQQTQRLDRSIIRFYVGIGISVAILSSSLFIILNGSYEAPTEKWAFGSVGTIVGYWLKS